MGIFCLLIDTKKEACLAYCKQRSPNIIKVFVDIGIFFGHSLDHFRFHNMAIYHDRLTVLSYLLKMSPKSDIILATSMDRISIVSYLSPMASTAALLISEKSAKNPQVLQVLRKALGLRKVSQD